MQNHKITILKLITVLSIAILIPFLHFFLLPDNFIHQIEADFAAYNVNIIENNTSNPLVMLIVYMNHSLERKLNVILLLACTAYAVLHNKKERKKMALHLIYLLLVLEFGVWLNHYIFGDLLEIQRHSPNAALDLTRVSTLYPINGIKTESFDTFPGGHAFAFFMWALMYWRVASRKISLTFLTIAVIFSLPRLLVGLHWITDILYSIYLAFMYRYFAFSIPKFRKYFINK